MTHVHFLDPYRDKDSLVHALDARVKLVLAVAFIFVCALMPSGAWPIYLLMLSLVFSGAVLSELGLKFMLQRSLLALPFLLAALPLPFTIGGPELLRFPLGAGMISISLQGTERFLSIVFKSWMSVQAAILLASTTPFPDLLLAMRALRLPRILVSIIGLMWRYIFVMVDEVLRMLRARSARSGLSSRPDLRAGGSLAWRARVTGGMAGSLFLRSLERSDRIYAAMLARGYDGEVRSLPQPAMTASGWRILAGGLTLVTALLLFAVLFWR
jgi:cobalt/nickel transport system permease protein